MTAASRGPGRSWSARLRDPRLVVLALLASLVVFLVASSRHGSTPEPTELPAPPYSHLPLGRPDPTTAQARIGDYLQIDVPSRPDDRYATVITQSAAPGTDVLDLISAPGDVPQLRAVRVPRASRPADSGRTPGAPR